MRPRFLIVVLILVLAIHVPLVHADDLKPKLAIHVGKVITCVGEPIIGGTILVSEGKIEAIGKTKGHHRP